jgi:hypothetical protein
MLAKVRNTVAAVDTLKDLLSSRSSKLGTSKSSDKCQLYHRPIQEEGNKPWWYVGDAVDKIPAASRSPPDTSNSDACTLKWRPGRFSVSSSSCRQERPYARLHATVDCPPCLIASVRLAQVSD